MTDTAANSSWHPAFMPNNNEPTFSQVNDDAPTDSATPAMMPTQDHDATSDSKSHDGPEPLEEDSHIDAWMSPDDEEDGAAAWLAHPEVAAPEPAVSKESEAEAEGQPQPSDLDERIAAEPSAQMTSAQHSSSMSFARTVSHEVNFNDDDDGDFTLQRTDTDPFKFMPLSDRTNSFPVVPPSESQSHEHDVPLPSSQALEVLEETENDVDFDEQQFSAQISAQADPGHPIDSFEKGHRPSGSMGGDVLGFEGQVSDERYAEGVPLISQSANQESQEAEASRPTATGVSFADEDGNDDFFTQIHGADEKTSIEPDNMPPLQRKSTTQVMGDLGLESAPRQLAFDETIAEESSQDEEHDAGKGVSIKDHPSEPEAKPEQKGDMGEPDLSAKWEEAFGGEDDDGDFLLENSAHNEEQDLDAAAFLGSDDEGFLEDNDDSTPAPHGAALTPQAGSEPRTNRYLPQKAASQPSTPSYMPGIQPMAQTPQPLAYAAGVQPPPFQVAPQHSSAQEARPSLPKAQSFADKSKGGYSSPYDLPSDLVTTVVKPRKRPSLQQISAAPASRPTPARSVSSPGHPPTPVSPPSSSHGIPSAAVQQKSSTSSLRNSSSFFEDLPMTTKPRPSSRHSAGVPSPAFPASPSGPPMSHQMPPPPPPANFFPAEIPPSINRQIPGVTDLIAPAKASPYASLQSSSVPVTPMASSSASRYSPAPAHTASGAGAPHAAPTNRYSPAPSVPRAANAYSPTGTSTTTPPVLPHQPRTSSPLTHFESYGEISMADRRASSSHESRLNRVPSLPPTREVEEEDDEPAAVRSASATHAPPAHTAASRYSSMPATTGSQTPPPVSGHTGSATLSPPQRTSSNYMPQPAAAAHAGPAPPRAQSQSPGATRVPTSPVLNKAAQSAYAPAGRARQPSLTMNIVAPTDGREHDPLQRWRGVPVFAWGVGGMIVTSFPKSIPRYGRNQNTPSIVRSPGEVKVKNIREVEPLQDRLAKFPGPLRGKSKKKEAISWLAAGIESIEKDLPEVSFQSELSLEAKRSIERLLLWKVLRVFIEYDGILEGNSAAEKAVRDILSPGTITPTSDNDALFPGDPALGTQSAPATSMQADAVDAATMEQIRHDLLRGDRESAVWAAADKRLWGHAMLMSQTVSPDLYRRVAQEFVRKEVNYPGHSNESLAALYQVMSGSHEECVDELVPSHARAGLQLMSTEAVSNSTKVTMDGLDKWRETLALVLSNRSPDDTRGLKALGMLLSSYGRAEAAHICFLFSRHVSVFGGLDDPNVNFVLLGSDHHQQSDQFAKDVEALQLSEVYELGLSLSGGAAASAGAPHLAAYKLLHAITLAEYGYRDKALQYCEAIATSMTSQTRRSPYHHAVLVAAVDDFMTRLRQAPKGGETSSWMSKPNMNKVSDSMWSRFNKFVAGDENDTDGNGATPDGDAGPFARIAGTPNISRSPSVSNFEMYGGSSPNYPMNAVNAGARAQSAAASRYAPGSSAQPGSPPNSYEHMPQYALAPRGSMERSSNEYPNGSADSGYPGASDFSPSHNYQPTVPVTTSYPPANQSFQMQDPAAQSPYALQESPDIQPAYEAVNLNASAQGYQPSPYGYEPPHMTASVQPQAGYQPEQAEAGGYEPPSFQPYGYEPPSYEPASTAEDGDEVAPPRKKSFMDDDDDYFQGAKPEEKTKSDKDRENQELFRKAAEEDGEFGG